MALFKTQFEILTQVRRVVYTGTNQVIMRLVITTQLWSHIFGNCCYSKLCPHNRTWQMVACSTPYPSCTGTN